MIDNEEYFNEDLVDNLLDEDEITTDTGEPCPLSTTILKCS